MKRKVNRVGINTLTVSLPSKWVKNNSIKVGDEIEVEEKGKSLSISIEHSRQGREKDIEIKEESTLSFIRSIISNSYKKGYDLLNISFDDASTLHKIQDVIDGLLGFEIIEQGEDRCVIKNVAASIESEFDLILKKSFILVMSLPEITLRDLKKGKLESLNEIRQIKKTITKSTDFCKRILSKDRRGDENTIFLYLIIWTLEKISNEFAYIYEYLCKYEIKKISTETYSFFERTQELVSLFYHGFYQKSNEKIKKCGEIKDQMLFHELYELNQKIDKKESSITHHLATIVRKVQDMVGPYFGYVL